MSMTPLLETPVRRRLWPVLVLGAVALAILLALGTWQVRRLAWKEGLIATVEARVHSEPRTLRTLEELFAATGDVDYWPVRVEGEFLHEGERHFLSTWEGRSGFNVFTPLRLADGRILFVNRGFVPYDRKDPLTRSQGQVAGEVTVIGLARNPVGEKPSWLLPDNRPDKNIFYWKDLDAMAASAGLPADAVLLPFSVDAGPAPNPGGLPQGGVTILEMPNNHLQYAVTWYGLAAALVAVLAALVLRGRGARRP